MTQYKLSYYNHFLYVEDEDKYLIYNSISNGLAKLEPELFNLLKADKGGIAQLEKDNSTKELLHKLHSGNIIVEKDLNEIEFLKTKFNMSKFGSRALSLTIVTTLDCNLNCIYCYEGHQSEKYADVNIEDDIVEFVSNKLKSMGYKSLFLNWYGGEPMLNKEFIFSLSKKLITLCKNENVNYGAMMVTNGTILNKKIAGKLKSLKVSHMQITIDGPMHIHDSRRPLKKSKKSSYQLIVGNIKRIMGIIPIQIRINVDKSNFSATLQLLENFDKDGWLKSSGNIFVYIGYTREWTSRCSNILPNCFSMKEFSEAEIEFHKLLISKGYNVDNLYPRPASVCVAVSPHGFVIDPGGDIHKCWSDVGDKSVYLGNVKEPVTLNSRFLKWLSYDPLSEFPECQKCNLFPACGGGCPYVHINQKEKLVKDKHYNCTPWKIFMKQKMNLFLQKKAEELKNNK